VHRFTKEKGFSLLEVLVVIGIATIVMSVMLPNLSGFMRTYRRDGVIDRVIGDLRSARSKAITTGWQYRVMGFNEGSGNTYKNQYRIMARRSSADGWPADTVATMQTTTQLAGPWINISTLYPGVTLNKNNATPVFSVAFDSRGVRIEVDASFDPLVISSQVGAVKSVRVSAVGSASVQ
jgi:type IV fimbrial biogenesis protein FimT